jgi:Major capsid protein N-terminus/Large eukaryotic DNA virus major capsid protein
MPGGLLQLVGRGAQDQLITGNPSFTQFRSVYKRHTDFAMEHFRLYFKTTILSYPSSGTLTLRTKVERYAQLLSDCYLSITLPDIFSPVVPLGSNQPPSTFNINSNAIPYEFQWIRNIGYNMINYVSILVNGQEVVRHTGEWMKLYANLQFDANKRAILDRMVGNLPELYDPANANGRINQYPSSISTSTTNGQASIPGRVLQIPLHFWFCESIGKALPLIALQYSDVEIVVELANMYQLFTVIDVNPNNTLTYGTRIAPDPSSSLYQISHFLSPPSYDATTNTIPDLRTWNINPYIEANYIFVSDAEMAYLARTDHSFLIKQIDVKTAGKQYGPSNDLELVMRNLCTRIVWVFQRDDLQNQPDNYTNWSDLNAQPNTLNDMYSSGSLLASNVSQRDILLESSVILDTQERFGIKQTEFFRDIEPYRHSTGNPLPGVYLYSFQLDNSDQPSGSLNGSMFNRTLLRNTLISPPYTTSTQSGTGILQQCVLKSTVNNPNPTVVNPNAVDQYGNPLYTPDQLVTIITKAPNTTVYQYTYTVTAYTESYNFLRIVGGIGNVVFSS